MPRTIKVFYLFSLLIYLLITKADGQFWKLNSLTDRDLFIMETKASMASGICYKTENIESKDPELRLKTISYCCNGYLRNADSLAIQCNPICNEDCNNGICTAPDTCECYPGYTRLGGRCEEL